MTNALPIKDYKEIKNKVITVLTFENGIRKITHGGLNYKQAMELMIKSQVNGEVSLVFETIPKGMDTTKWEYSYFLDFLGINETANNPMQEEMICPYCKVEFDDTSGLSDAGITKCPVCENKFNYERETSHSYTVEKI